jgi:hypothetical protein
MERLQNIFRLETGSATLVLEKLIMIKHKEYKGKKFVFDFKIKKKWTRQLYKKYSKIYTYDQWKETWFRDKTLKKKK